MGRGRSACDASQSVEPIEIGILQVSHVLCENPSKASLGIPKSSRLSGNPEHSNIGRFVWSRESFLCTFLGCKKLDVIQSRTQPTNVRITSGIALDVVSHIVYIH